MKQRGRWWLAVVLLVGASTVVAQSWLKSLEGSRTQGTLLRGQVAPGVTVTLGQAPVRVTEEGFFVIGFGRDADLQQTLVLSREGETREVPLALEARNYDIQHVEGVPKRTVEPPPPAVLKRIRQEVAAIRRARDINSDRRAFLGDFQWPLTGRISGVYGSQRVYNGKPGRPHYGVDVARPNGTLVVAPAEGKVTLVQEDNFYSGGTLILDHGFGVSSTLIHLSEVLVAEGEVVEQGQPVARVGASGRATGPHLDWRINWFQVRIDPQTVVPPMPDR